MIYEQSPRSKGWIVVKHRDIFLKINPVRKILWEDISFIEERFLGEHFIPQQMIPTTRDVGANLSLNTSFDALEGVNNRRCIVPSAATPKNPQVIFVISIFERILSTHSGKKGNNEKNWLQIYYEL